MAMQEVTSSNVHSYDYCPETQELTVRYRSGPGHFVYGQVPPAKWAALQVVQSKGSYIAVEIKGKHPMLRREVPEPEDYVIGPERTPEEMAASFRALQAEHGATPREYVNVDVPQVDDGANW